MVMQGDKQMATTTEKKMKFSTFVFSGFGFLAAFALLNGSVLHLSTNLDRILHLAELAIK
jgi:hypothetical protein